MKRIFRQILYNIPTIKALKRELDSYKTEFPPGHYYSPISTKEEIISSQNSIFNKKVSDIKGIDYNEQEQLDLLNKLQAYYSEMPFRESKEENLRFYINNPYYYYSDAVCLYSIIRHFKPARIVEVGSGFSSALMLDINDIFFDSKVKFDFIDPYPDRLYSLIKEADSQQNIITEKVQNVDVDFFHKLNENDILFIDSSHVSKIGSDVNFLIFDVLPSLKSGVLIHFHDIFYNFEYPQYWAVTKKWSWNENYLLRAFLQYNHKFKIILFNTFLENQYREWFTAHMPLCIKKEDSIHGSIWLVKK